MFTWGKHSVVATAKNFVAVTVTSAMGLTGLAASVNAQENVEPYLPAMRFEQAQLNSPEQVRSFYTSSSTSTATSSHPRIKELARALNNDPANMYYYKTCAKYV